MDAEESWFQEAQFLALQDFDSLPDWEWQDDLDHRRWWEEYDRVAQAHNQHSNCNRTQTAKEPNMKISEEFSGTYLKAVDLHGKKVRVNIKTVRREEVGQGEDRAYKPVVYFEGKDKGLVLNKTNATTIAETLGDDTDDWPGRQIVLFSMKVQFGPKLVDAIRVDVPIDQETAEAAAQAKQAQQPEQRLHQGVPESDIDDDIPF